MPALDNDRHERFAIEYAACLNGTQAYMRVYRSSSYDSARSSAADLLAKPSISLRVSELKKENTERAGITAQRVLSELAAIAFSDITDIVQTHPGITELRNIEDLPPNVRAAIAEVSDTLNETEANSNRRVQVKLHPKPAALAQLFKYLGLDSDINIAIATLAKYGIRLVQKPDGWVVEDSAN